MRAMERCCGRSKRSGVEGKIRYDIDCEKPNPLRERFQIFTFETLKTKHISIIKLCYECLSVFLFFFYLTFSTVGLLFFV